MDLAKEIQGWLPVIRDVAIVFGVPLLVSFGFSLYRRHIAALKAENEVLKLTQWAGALELIKAQEEAHGVEIDRLRQQLSQAKENAVEAEQQVLKNRLAEEEGRLAELKDRRHTISAHADAAVLRQFVGDLDSAALSAWFELQYRRVQDKAQRSYDYSELTPREKYEAVRDRAHDLLAEWAKEKGIHGEWEEWRRERVAGSTDLRRAENGT